eukprot:gene15882-21532_t
MQTASMIIPALPINVLNLSSSSVLSMHTSIFDEIDSLSSDLTNIEDKREIFFKQTRQINKNIAIISNDIRNGLLAKAELLIELTEKEILKLLETIVPDPVTRESKLSFTIERYCVTKMHYYFFTYGQLISQDMIGLCNDDEYLGGVLSFLQEISRYAINRACEGDENSVAICRQLVTQVNGQMLEFNFRNGPLRRKYDGLKYCQRTMENISYELSLTSDINISSEKTNRIGVGIASNEAEIDTQNIKKICIEDTNKVMTVEVNITPYMSVGENIINIKEFQQIQNRMDSFDKLRESVIKDSRDVQKLSKLSIFSLIRGQPGDAEKKLEQARAMAEKIMLIVDEHPLLRPGSFSNSLEEYAEGYMLFVWIKSERGKRKLLSKSDLKPLVNTTEYIGGLSDFTGELGRLAVAHAAKR